MKPKAGRRIFERVVTVSGAIVRSLIGIGASALLFLSFKKKKKIH